MFPTQDRIFWMPNFETGSESGTGKMNCMNWILKACISILICLLSWRGWFHQRRYVHYPEYISTSNSVRIYLLLVPPACHDSTAALSHMIARCESARSGRREHLPFCRWAARRALRLETRIDLTRAIESWYRAVESWVRFKVFFRWILEYKSKIFLLKMIVIYNNWNMYFIFIWKFFVQSNIKVVKFSWMCLSGRIMVPLLYLYFS